MRALIALAIATTLAAPTALAQSEQRRLVTASTLTFASFLNDPDMGWLRENVGRARAVMIAPEFTKAGIIVGGAGGRAVVVVRDPKSGRWAGPAFYSLVTASIGLQAGVSVSEVVTLIMTEKAVAKLLSNSFRMGGDIALAVGPVGGGAQSAFVADVVSFSRGQGVYVGLNLDGTIVSTSDDWNDLYYGHHVQAAGHPGANECPQPSRQGAPQRDRDGRQELGRQESAEALVVRRGNAARRVTARSRIGS